MSPQSLQFRYVLMSLIVIFIILFAVLDKFEDDSIPSGNRLNLSVPHYASVKSSGGLATLMLRMPKKRTSKWIVVTSIQAPTDDLKRLASFSEWTVVVVGDSKTPRDWNLTDVHFLSLEMQSEIGFQSVQRLPTKSYTRKNAGYLYAIANGAEWIYDTDDDNKPFGKGLLQFEFASTKTRGLRFTKLEFENSTLQESLFNPYRHFGRSDMWPRGFPLEYIKNHDHHEGSYRLCRVQRPPAVQQGIVQKDPDVDAIYRLLNAELNTGLDESFNDFAPPVILAPGTYAPWNSQNTLFARSAFFGLFLPTTVAFRVTDIWRSYFTQALLHLAGETISFVPVNAIQRRNAHSYLKDFSEEIDVYEKAGSIVQFINQWKCKYATMDKCTIDLAKQFTQNGFWGKEDSQLVLEWVTDLQKIGYIFPSIQPSSTLNDYPIGEDSDKRRNCRRAHISLRLNVPPNKVTNENKKTSLMEQRSNDVIKNFGDIKEWCDKSFSNVSEHWYFPAPDKLYDLNSKKKALVNNYQLVAIISNNYHWSLGMGLLQRIYEAHFAMLIFCGNYRKQGQYAANMKNPEGKSEDDSSFPHIKKPINYIDLSNDEVHRGYYMYYCLAKVEEMKIQNVKGYVMFSDDMTFNFWNEFSLEHVEASRKYEWWDEKTYGEKYGFVAMNRSIQLMKKKYVNDPEMKNFVKELSAEVKNIAKKNEPADPFEYLMFQGHGKNIGDWIYVPTSNISFVAMFAQLAHEGGLFHEIFVSKILHILSSEGFLNPKERIHYLWGAERENWPQTYNATYSGMHPIKFSQFKEIKRRVIFCDVVLNEFYNSIFKKK